MQSNIFLSLSRRTLFLIVLTGVVFFVGFIYKFIINGPRESASIIPIENALASQNQTQSNPTSSLVPKPIRLKIPKINVDSAIEYMGLDSYGVMEAPKKPENTGWYSLGVRPGEIGSAVIDGHYGWKNGIPTVFDKLNKLEKGDKIYVEDEEGKTTTFSVTGIRSFDPKADASDVFVSNDGKSHLNLITCEGIWDKILKRYSKRLVVFTDRE